MASQVPAVKSAAFTLYFTLYKNDGTVIVNPGTITKKVSKDGGTLADAANSVTEIDNTYGLNSLVFSTTEMNCDALWYYIKDDTTGCVPITGVIYTSAQTLDTIDGNVDAVKVKTDYLPSATAGAAGGVFIAGSNAATTVNITGNITGNLSGSVGTVTTNQAKYVHGAVWVDTVNGSSGTVSYTNGIPTNPSDTLANAATIADNLKLKRFWIQSGSSITLGADYLGYIFDGRGYTLALGGRDLSRCHIENAENVTGTATAATSEFFIRDSHIGAATLGEVDVYRCTLTNTVTLSAATSYFFSHCHGVDIGAGFPTVDFGSAVGASGCVIDHWGGNLTIANMKTGDTLAIDGNGTVTLAASCTGGTIYVAGNINLLDSSTGTTLFEDARLDQGAVNAQCDTAVSDAGIPAATRVELAAELALIDAPISLAMLAASYVPPDSASTIADAVWDESMADHLTPGSTGASLNGAGSAGDPWNTALPGAYGEGSAGYILAGAGTDATAIHAAVDHEINGLTAIKTDTAAILLDTTEVQVDLANGGRLDLLIDAIKDKTDNLPASPAATTDIPTANITAIKAKTDNLPSDPADQSAIEAAITALTEAGFKKNAAVTGFTFFMADTLDHVTGKTGLTITATRSLDGASFASCTNSASELTGGWYKIDLAAGDMNADVVSLRFTATGADATGFTIKTSA